MNREKLKNLSLNNYSQCMGYTDKGDRMANSYSISWRTWKWTNRLFFHPLDLTILNTYTILSFCSSKTDHRKLSSGFGLKHGNKFKGATSSNHSKRKTRAISQLNDMMNK